MSKVCVFGEVLFDHFPDGSRVLGGAPFNVAWHLQAFGQSPAFISRIGKDPEGDTIRRAMQAWGMRTDSLQVDTEHPTGRVSVRFVDGEPAYDIVRPCAYDAIEAQDNTCDCSLLYHGTLALREPASREALERIKACSPGIVFVDVNLRPPWWQRESVLALMESAHWVKLNGDELSQLLPTDSPGTDSARDFIEAHALDGLVLTHGGSGAEILTADGGHAAITPEPGIDIVDTVGAGDAFASVIILGLANGWPLETMLVRAQAFASRIVGRRGATVDDSGFYRSFIDSWKLENH